MRARHPHVEDIARFVLGGTGQPPEAVLRAMRRHGLCRETRQLASLFNRILGTTEAAMPLENAALTELIRLIDDLIDKSRQENLKDQALDFNGHYQFVLRYGWKHGVPKECQAKEEEVHEHWTKALAAAKAGNADALQEALSGAMDDLRELAQCMGINPVPF